MTERELLAVACEQFLGKNVQDVKNVVLQTLEGHLRSILGAWRGTVLLLPLGSVDTPRSLPPHLQGRVLLQPWGQGVCARSCGAATWPARSGSWGQRGLRCLWLLPGLPCTHLSGSAPPARHPDG